MIAYLSNFPLWVPVTLSIITFVFFFIALLKLRRRQMNDITRLLWLIFLILLPFIGSILFFLVHPGQLSDAERKSV